MPTQTPPSRRAFLPWVQALRAFAAVAVAFHHIAHDDITNGGDPAGWLTAVTRFFPWDTGVDIFFVISGFVIVHASASLFGAPGGSRIFLRRRLRRIVPLYWIMTSLFLLILLAGRSTIHGAIGGPAYIAASFLFLPWPRPDGLMQPAFSLGWTLNYEMFFYAIFTPFLLLARHWAVPGVILVLSALVAFGMVFGIANPQLSFWSNPIILEFCAGMLIALAPPCLNLPARLLLVILAIAALHLATIPPPAWRAVTYGAPAIALVAAAALGAPGQGNRGPEQWLIRLGDASYAMYLAHPFVMRAFSVLWNKIHERNELTGTIYVLAGLSAAQLCALAINMCERKVKARLRRGVKNEVV